MDLYENEFVTENLPALDGSDAKGVADAIDFGVAVGFDRLFLLS